MNDTTAGPQDPIPASKAHEVLADEGTPFEGDDDTPTTPDLLAEQPKGKPHAQVG
jgi:hypothetical protein